MQPRGQARVGLVTRGRSDVTGPPPQLIFRPGGRQGHDGYGGSPGIFDVNVGSYCR
jgi:hypothetical protein